jgi:hypothetical protein
MSRTLDKFPEQRRGSGHNWKYNWDEWKDGRVHELIHSSWSSTCDFDVPVESMRSMVYTYANKEGLSARTAKTKAGIAIQFISTTDNGEILEW